MPALVRAPIVALLVLTIGQAMAVAPLVGNLKYYPEIPWALPATVFLMSLFWLYAAGGGIPASTQASRRRLTRRNSVSPRVWRAAFPAIIASVVAVSAFRLAIPTLMETAPPSFALDVHAVPVPTLIGMLLALALSAGVVEEIAFRGYLQKMLEEAYGLVPALAITGVAFWFAHSDKVLLSHLPFHMLASVLLGVTVYLARSLWPAIIGHALGDAVLQPAYVFQKPEFVWTLLNARPVWEGRAETVSTKLEMILDAIQPSRLFGQGSDGLFAVVFWIFALSLIVAIFSLMRLGRVAATERQDR